MNGAPITHDLFDDLFALAGLVSAGSAVVVVMVIAIVVAGMVAAEGTAEREERKKAAHGRYPMG